MEAVPYMRKFVVAGAIAALAMISTSAPAYGKGCSGNVKDPPSSVQQYVEQQPTACGSTATGNSNKTRKIPKSIERKIDQDGGKDAELLKRVVSNEGYGAPQVKIKAKKKSKATKSQSKTTPGQKVILSDSEKRSSSALSASMGAFTDGSDSRLIGLIVLMVAIAAIVVASAFRRRRLPR
jgi:hypothetical protein